MIKAFAQELLSEELLGQEATVVVGVSGGPDSMALLHLLQELGELITRFEKLSHELRFADQGYTGFFAELSWGSGERLDKLYRIDEQIVESLTALSITVEVGEFRASDLARELRTLERTLDQRRQTILGLLPDDEDTEVGVESGE